MSTLRRNPVTHGWTIYPEGDFQVPRTSCPEAPEVSPAECPFCEGKEHTTPPEIMAIRPHGSMPNSRGWSVRTVPDINAVLRIEGAIRRRAEGIYDLMEGVGAHELIIETPDHYALFSEYDHEKMREVVWMYRERMRDLLQDERFRYIQICRNYGLRAGARIPHPHSLAIALPVVPRWVREEIARAAEFWKMKERCLFCDMIALDRKANRVIFENSQFIALEPFAAGVPYETWIFPVSHQSRFQDIEDYELDSLVEALQKVTKALAQKLNNPPYNLIIHTSPAKVSQQWDSSEKPIAEYYHWHIEIIPRLRELNGFEYGTGLYVNPLLPETAAAHLREILDAIG